MHPFGRRSQPLVLDCVWSLRVKYFKLNLYQARRELLAKVKLSSQRFEIWNFIFSQSSVWTWGFWNKYRELWQVEFITSDVTVTLWHYDIDTPFLLDTGKFSFILENGLIEQSNLIQDHGQICRETYLTNMSNHHVKSKVVLE